LSIEEAKFVSLPSDNALGLESRATIKLSKSTAKLLAKLLYEEIKKKL